MPFECELVRRGKAARTRLSDAEIVTMCRATRPLPDWMIDPSLLPKRPPMTSPQTEEDAAC